jgi:hypothetical protein
VPVSVSVAAKLPYREAVGDHSPGLQAWAILLNRFAVRSIDLLIKIRLKPGLRAIARPGQGTQTRRMVLATALVADSPYWH